MYNKKNNKLYYSYSKRIIIRFLLFILVLLITLFLFSKSVNLYDKSIINYSELGTIDYKVFLKSNDFYDSNYLEKDMIYVTNLIDKINVDFEYNFIFSHDNNIEIKYDLIADIVISDDEINDVYYNKELFLAQTDYKKVNNKFTIYKNIDIDYNKYNDISNKFKTSYGVNTISNLVVSLNIYKININNLELNSKSNMKIIIPLSKKSININTEYNDLSNTKKIVVKNKAIKNNYLLILSIILLLFDLSILFKIIKLLLKNNKKNKYDLYLNKIFKEYDRFIVSTSFLPNLNKYNVIKVNSFNELLDVRDSLKLPILYYNIVTHFKCHLYILYLNDLYLLTIKKVDLDK